MSKQKKELCSGNGDGYERIANAVIILAAKDYLCALRKLERNPKNDGAIMMRESVERFFRSEWYSALTSVDGEFLIRNLQKEVSA